MFSDRSGLPSSTRFESACNAAGFNAQMDSTLPGVSAFVANLANVKQSRPQIATYPKISQVLGNMIVSVLLGTLLAVASGLATAVTVAAINHAVNTSTTTATP